MDDIVEDAAVAADEPGVTEGVEHLVQTPGGPVGAERPDPAWPEHERRPEGGAAWA